MKCLIVNRCNTDNFGDRIISNCMDNLFRCAGFDVMHADYSFVPHYSALRVMNRLITIFAKKLYMKHCVTMLKKCDTFVIGGGELLSPGFYSNFAKWNHLANQVHTRRKTLFGIGFVDQFDNDQLAILGKILTEYDGIYLRDRESYESFSRAFAEYGLQNVQCIPDVVFSMQIPKRIKKDGLIIGVTDLMRIKKHNFLRINSKEELFTCCVDQIKKALPELNDRTVRIIYNTESDKRMADEFKCYLAQKQNINAKRCRIRDEKAFIDLVNSAEIVISPRMHACIIGCVCGAKVYPLIISKKMKSFYDSYLFAGIDFSRLPSKIYRAAEEVYNTAANSRT